MGLEDTVEEFESGGGTAAAVTTWKYPVDIYKVGSLIRPIRPTNPKFEYTHQHRFMADADLCKSLKRGLPWNSAFRNLKTGGHNADPIIPTSDICLVWEQPWVSVCQPSWADDGYCDVAFGVSVIWQGTKGHLVAMGSWKSGPVRALGALLVVDSFKEWWEVVG